MIVLQWIYFLEWPFPTTGMHALFLISLSLASYPGLIFFNVQESRPGHFLFYDIMMVCWTWFRTRFECLLARVPIPRVNVVWSCTAFARFQGNYSRN